jgi:enamine deaminase RidA (YjgF/YER057c/UK114 family)
MSLITRSVERGSMIYVQAAASQPRGDIRAQTWQVLDHIERALAGAGLDKSKILTAEVLLADMNLREAHSAAWSKWINGEHSPLLTCKPAALAHPDALVEITVTAAR